jgi:hypothetical protein
VAGCSVGRGAMALNHVTTLVRFQPGQLAPFGSASTRPWYGRAARFDTGEGLHVTVVSAVSTRPCQGCRASSNLVGHSMPF